MTASLENLVASGQGVLSKRMDLALLDGQAMLSRTIRGMALLGLVTLLVAGAWFALIACAIVALVPTASWALSLAMFALLNGVAGCALAAVAMRPNSAPVTSAASDPSPPVGSAPRSDAEEK